MPLFQTLAELKQVQKAQTGQLCGLVPTMGTLHQGHLALIKQAQKENECVWVSIFVNPTQFNNKSDLSSYPSNLAEDIKAIHEVDPSICIFAPATTEMYPQEVVSATFLFDGLDGVMEGADRPGHFQGVITIVSKLFEAIHPDTAYFGEKDFQQLQIIKNWSKKARVPTKIFGCPIVRESHGLAMSSRNELLSKEARKEAGFIYHALIACKNTENKTSLNANIKKIFDEHPTFELHYCVCLEEETLSELEDFQNATNSRIFIAASVEGVRLIDNIALK